MNGSRESATNGAKTTEVGFDNCNQSFSGLWGFQVNGDVELTSIEPETGPLSDEPEVFPYFFLS